MCDPVTLTAVSGFASAQGASMLATYGTGTFLGSVGSGLVTASTFINTSSSIYKASSAIAGGLSALNVGNTLSAAGRVYGGSLQQQYNNQQAQLEQQKYVEQQKQMKAQIERDKLEARSQELDRRRTYLRNAASNQSQMAVSGVTLASASYSALLDSNKDTYFRDVDYIKMLGKERDYVNKTELEQSNIAQRSAQKQYKTQAKANVVNTLLDANKLYGV